MTQQTQLNIELTGFQRFILTKQWYKVERDNFPDKEDYIKLVCKKKGIIYTLPIKVYRVI